MPDWKEEIRLRLTTLSLEPTREAEIVEELAQHIEDRYAELLAGGASHEEATRVVCVELNESETLQRELRAAERAVTREPVVEGYDVASNVLAGLWQDLRYGARMLMKKPAFTVIAIVTIALGISANTTIFSTVDAMMLRPFSFPNQQRLVVLFERKPSIGVTRASISPGNVIEWRAQTQTLQEVVVMRNRDYTLTGEGSPERVSSYGVSAEFFEALGVKPLLGRTFQRGEDEAGREQVAVLSHAFWQARFGGDSQIIDKQILLDGKPFIVVGVMPKGFDFPYDGGEMWTPFAFEPKMKEDHSNHYLRVLGLLRPGVSIAQANADLDQISKRVEQRYPDGEAGHSAYAEDLNGYYTRGIRVAVPGMIGSAIFVLLIACANVANLFVARTSARRKEMAVRLALGATRFRVIRQTLTESVMLALAGGAFGCLLTRWSLEAFPRIIPIGMAKYIPGSSRLALNLRVLVFTALISVLTGVLFGLVPALQGARTSLSETLKESGRKGAVGGGGQSLLRKGLVIAELALSLVLLIGAALFVRSVIQIVNADLGVKPDNVVTMTLDLPRDKYNQAQQRRALFEQLLERVAACPASPMSVRCTPCL